MLNANNINIAKFIPPFPYPYNKKDAKEFVKSCIKHSKEKPRLNYEFGIELKSEKRIIGMISITHIDKFHEYATVGYWLGEKYWKKGYMTEALRELIIFYFTKLKLRRINISAFAENKASNKIIIKMGFKYEGTMIKHVKDKATKKIHDHNFYGMLKEDWNK